MWCLLRLYALAILSGSIQQGCGQGGKSREAEGLRERSCPDRASAVGTDGQVEAGEFEQELLPLEQMELDGRRRVCGQRTLKEACGFLEFALNISRCHEPKVTDADKAVGEHMEKEAADKLLCREADEPVGSWVRVVPGAEGNGLIIIGHEPLVGDGHPVGVMTQVREDVPGPAEGGVGVDDPLDRPEFFGEPLEGRWVCPMGDLAGEGKLPLREGLLEAFKKLSSDHFGQRSDRDEEVILSWYPSVTFEAQTSGRDHHMEVDVESEFLAPCVKNGGKPW